MAIKIYGASAAHTLKKQPVKPTPIPVSVKPVVAVDPEITEIEKLKDELGKLEVTETEKWKAK